MKKKELERRFNIIKVVMLEENPSALVSKGINDYEFDSEIKSIARLIDINTSTKDICLIIKKVFKSSFGKEISADYDKMSQEIYLKLNSRVTRNYP